MVVCTEPMSMKDEEFAAQQHPEPHRQAPHGQAPHSGSSATSPERESTWFDAWSPYGAEQEPTEQLPTAHAVGPAPAPVGSAVPVTSPVTGPAPAWGASASQAITEAPAPAEPPRRGPGWTAVSAMVLTGMLLSSGLTLGGVVAYDQLTGDDQPTATASPSPARPASTSPVSTDGHIEWSAVAEQVSRSTVAIRSLTANGPSEGTGVVYRPDGTIVTNNHVVAGARQVQVTLVDGLSYDAKVVGADPSTDVAVIRLTDPPKDLTAADFGESKTVQVGQPVMAVGTPLGLENTVTTGIISAVNRPVTTTGNAAEGTDTAFTSALQTDAAINPGNSGGPLVDGGGHVIGINTAIAGLPRSEGSGQAGSIGLGFAIPSDTAAMIADQLIEHGEARHAFVGISSRDGQSKVGAVTHSGAQIVDVVADGPAARGELRVGDLITAVDDVPVRGAAALTGIVRGLGVGTAHQLTVIRDGQKQTIEVTLGTAP